MLHEGTCVICDLRHLWLVALRMLPLLPGNLTWISVSWAYLARCSQCWTSALGPSEQQQGMHQGNTTRLHRNFPAIGSANSNLLQSGSRQFESDWLRETESIKYGVLAKFSPLNVTTWNQHELRKGGQVVISCLRLLRKQNPKTFVIEEEAWQNSWNTIVGELNGMKTECLHVFLW